MVGYRKSLVDTAWVLISFNKWLKNISFMHLHRLWTVKHLELAIDSLLMSGCGSS